MSVFTKMAFEEWSALATDDPLAFEQLREKVIRDFLEQCPPAQQPRLRCLQWRIDQVRERSSNPMSATIHLYAMMWERLTGDGGMLDVLANRPRPVRKPSKTADILDFTSAKR